MRATVPLLLCILSSLVEVHSLTIPYLTFMGNNIPNHGYVDLNTVGTENTNKIQCYTDLYTCCSGAQGPDRGDWYFPNGTKLPLSGNVRMGRGDKVAVLEYNGQNTLQIEENDISGIYRCKIETMESQNKIGREILYVGLYTSGGIV